MLAFTGIRLAAPRRFTGRRAILKPSAPGLTALAFLAGIQVLAGQSPDAFETLATQARQAIQQERTGDARTLLDQALALNPLWEEGWWYRGGIWYEEGRLRESAQAFRNVTSLNPAMGPAWLMLGLSQYRMSDYHRALASIERAITLGFGGNQELRFTGYFHLGVLLTRAEEYERSFSILFTLAKNHSEHPHVQEAMGLCVLRLPFAPPELAAERKDLVRRAGEAAAGWAVEDSVRAEAGFEAILRDYGQVPNVHLAFGQFLSVRNPERALELFRKELEVSPDHVPARLQIAWLHLNRGRPREALEYAREASRLQSDSPSVRYVLGRILLDLGQMEGAIRELEAALTRFPESTQIRGALARAYFQAGRREDAQKQQAEVERLRASLQAREEGLIVGGAGRPDREQ